MGRVMMARSVNTFNAAWAYYTANRLIQQPSVMLGSQVSVSGSQPKIKSKMQATEYATMIPSSRVMMMQKILTGKVL